MKFGAHVSITGGYLQALKKITDIGGNCLQMFSASPRGWNKATPSEATIHEFLTLKKQLKIDPLYFHASYLINLADNGYIGNASRQILINELTLAPKIGVKGSIIHLGSYKENAVDIKNSLELFPTDSHSEKYPILIKNISEILKSIPRESLFIIENAGTRKIGRTIDEIAQIIDDLKDERVRVCLDTCHLHAAGYNLSTEKTFHQFLETFEEKIGISKLELWHINDSKDPYGSLRDRHANLGEGKVGLDTFRLIANHPQMRNIPLIIETPGFDDKGPDKKNLDILKNLVNS